MTVTYPGFSYRYTGICAQKRKYTFTLIFCIRLILFHLNQVEFIFKHKNRVASGDFILKMIISVLIWSYWVHYNPSKITCSAGNGMLKKTLGTSLYNNRETYETFLLQSHSASIHQRHLSFFMTEIYKSISKISLELKWLYFTY